MCTLFDPFVFNLLYDLQSLNADESQVTATLLCFLRRFVTVGRSFFTAPLGPPIPLGDGLDLWYGFFQSAIMGWKPFLNIDGKIM